MSAVARWALRASRPRGSVILAYHGLGPATRETDPRHLILPLDRFLAQVDALRDHGFRFVTVSQLVDGGPEGSAARSPLVALSFDDGLLSVAEPLLGLAEERIPATVYPVTGWLGASHPRLGDGAVARILDENDLRALADAGIEIGAHTVTHPDLSDLSFADCLRELQESRERLESIIGRPVFSFAYPFGRGGVTARRAACEAGFRSAVAEDGGRADDRMCLRRMPVLRGDGWSVFALKASGRWQGLATSAPGRTVRAATRGVRRRSRYRRERRAGR